jgi:hypothetical protein
MAAESRPNAYAGRFTLAYVVLLAAIAAAVVGLVVALSRSGGAAGANGPAWSVWQPTASGLGRAEQIAQYVAPEYKLPNGSELVAAIARHPFVNDPTTNTKIPVGYVGIKGVHGQPDRIIPVSTPNTVAFSLCGLGNACSIATGKPSVARGLLVRREIVELALYTFRYDSGVQNVIAQMPPRNSTTAPVVIFLQRSELAQELAVPLRRTLAAHTPGVGAMTPSDQQAVVAATTGHEYTSSATRAQDGSLILVLTHIPA